MSKNIVVMFGAVEDGDLNGFKDTFAFLAYRIFEGAEEIGYCALMPNGDVNDGTQEGCLEDEYSVDLYPENVEVIYHNNEDGHSYTYDEFMETFKNNEDWQLVGLYGELETV